jgi:predicted permease
MGEANVRNKVATFLEVAALNVLLPLMVLDSISKTELKQEVFFAVVAGFVLPVLTIGIYYFSKPLRVRYGTVPKHDTELLFMSGTFGGGSRGTALLTLLLAGSLSLPDYMKWFALVDLGNFFCLLLVIAPLIGRAYSTQASPGIWDRVVVFLKSYLFATFVVNAAYLAFHNDLPALGEMLESSSHDRRLAFTMIVFWAITLRFKADATHSFHLDLFALFGARATCGVVVTFLLWWLKIPTPVLVAVILLLLMPPSSTLPSIISEAGAGEHAKSYVSTFSGAFNIVYLFLVAFGIAAALTR